MLTPCQQAASALVAPATPAVSPAVTVLCCYCAGGAAPVTEKAVAALTEYLRLQLAGGNALLMYWSLQATCC